MITNYNNDMNVDHINSCLNKTIKQSFLEDNEFHIVFTDNTSLVIWDDGQSCCEDRYMIIDDDLSQFNGAVFLGVELKGCSDVDGGGEDHEIQFLEVQTNLGAISIATHNVHNGYYGGFSIKTVLRTI